jgi:hypothetical protein
VEEEKCGGGVWRRSEEKCGGGVWRRSVEECGGVWRSVEECGGVWRSVEECILVPRASRPHASSLGPGTHRTGTARKLALISNAHGN